MNYLHPFKDRAANDTPDSSMASSSGVTPHRQTAENTLLSKVTSFFSRREESPSAAAGSTNDLNSPLRKMVDGLSNGMPNEPANKGANLFGGVDEDDGNESGAPDNVIDVETSDDEAVSSPSITKAHVTNSASNSPIINLDGTHNYSPAPASSKFLQQALLKANKGSENSAISVDNTPAVTPARQQQSTVNEILEETPVSSRNEGVATPPSRRPLGNLSNTPNYSPMQQSSMRNGAVEDDFDMDLPPMTPRSAKKNKRRSVCALPAPRRKDDMPVSPSGN